MKKDDDLLCAVIAWDRSSYISLNDDFDVLEMEPQLLQYATPEQIFMKKEFVENLSEDSKSMIKFICDTPDDIFLCLLKENTKEDKISKKKFIAFLKAIGWERQRIEHCFREINLFTKYFT